MTFLSFVTTATAFRSLAATQILPFPLESDAVPALENRMSYEDVIEAQRVSTECHVAPGRAIEISVQVEFYLPKRAPSSIDIEEVAVMYQKLNRSRPRLRAKHAGRTRRRRTANVVENGVAGCWCHTDSSRRQSTDVTPHSAHSAGIQIHLVRHRLDTKDLFAVDRW